MSKTIKQIADELGVSKDRVKYLVKKLPSEWVEKRGNITYIKDDGERYIYILSGKKWGISDENTYVKNALDRVISTHLPTEEQAKDMEIERLKSRVAELERQLEYERASSEEKQAILQARIDEQIETSKRLIEDSAKLIKLIDQEQQLHAADKKALMLIEEQKPDRKLTFRERRAAKRAEKKARRKERSDE